MSAGPLVVHIPGRPIGKQRHRTVGTMTYTPNRTVDWERHAAAIIAAAAREQKFGLALSTPMWLSFVAVFAVARTAKHIEQEPHCAKPDVDNVCKIILDAIVRAGVLADDRVVACVDAKKVWSRSREGVDLVLGRLVGW